MLLGQGNTNRSDVVKEEKGGESKETKVGQYTNTSHAKHPPMWVLNISELPQGAAHIHHSS